MFSILPAFVSALFIGCGVYAISFKGINRVSLSFFLLCVTTACWQGVWALLFQTDHAALVHLLIKVGYLLILYLPTCFYLFLVEVCNKQAEKRFVFLSYGFASMLAVALLSDNLIVAGSYQYFFGDYPKAGPLLPLHIAQTCLLAGRCFFITYKKLKQTTGREHAQIRICLISLCIYSFAAIDYLDNYGFEFYPPGVLFLVASFVCFTVAIARYDLMNPYTLAASIAHEMRNPLIAINLYADEMATSLPALLRAYRESVSRGLCPDSISPSSFERLTRIPEKISQSVRQSNVTIDTFLAVAREVNVDTFSDHSIDVCVTTALNEFSFTSNERDLVRVDKGADFTFYGSSDLLIYVLFNLLKNALWAINVSKKGTITISTYASAPKWNVLEFSDTALGIGQEDLPYIFEAFFSTKRDAGGTGVGLSFCQDVLRAFGGRIRCQSEKGQFTSFFLEFPRKENGTYSARRSSSMSPVSIAPHDD